MLPHSWGVTIAQYRSMMDEVRNDEILETEQFQQYYRDNGITNTGWKREYTLDDLQEKYIKVSKVESE